MNPALFCRRATNLVKLDTNGEEKLLYEPGDHAAIFPVNRQDLVERILERMDCEVSPDILMKLECREEGDSSKGDDPIDELIAMLCHRACSVTTTRRAYVYLCILGQKFKTS